MKYYLIIFSITAYSSAWWSTLPSLPYTVSVWLAVLFFALKTNKIWRYLLALISGILWATLWGQWLLSDVLDVAQDKSDYIVTGTVSGIPVQNERSTRFIFEVESVEFALSKANKSASIEHEAIDSADTEQSVVPSLKRLQLNWYGPVDLQAGQRWQIEVRLRSPRGFSNPAGFDYRLWLLRRGISATGYVRHSAQAQLLEVSSQHSVDRYRHSILDAISELEIAGRQSPLIETAKGMLLALTIGDKRGLSQQNWQKFRVTGTIHLMVISGLHIGMAAAVGMLIGSVFGRCLAALGFACSRVQVGAIVALAFACIYTLMAGFSLATQRALIMLLIFFIAMLSKRALRPWLAFVWALTIQAMLDPLAALSAGFWLSFGAVATFIWYFSSYPRASWFASSFTDRRARRQNGGLRDASIVWKNTSFMWLQTLLEAQLLILLLLSGVLIYFQGNVALATPLVNLLAVPWFSLTIVPPALLGVLVFPVCASLAKSLWRLAAYQLQYFDQALDAILPYAESNLWQLVTDQFTVIAISVITAGLMLLLPRGLGMRSMASVLIAAVLLVAPPYRSPLEVIVLDVGQGLSVMVISPDRVMVYDAGRKYSENFDIGAAVVAPYLRSRGIDKIDVLVVSHSDADHSGGVQGLLNTFDVERIIAGQPELVYVNSAKHRFLDIEQCRRGMAWSWADVEFEIIHPDHANQSSDNASSCVIAIRRAEQTILLAGDIEADVERLLVKSKILPEAITLLVAPHHGSKTSSTEQFVSQLAPTHVVYSAGFHHHFGHPHALVRQRYTAINATQWSTGESGALSFVWSDKDNLNISSARNSLIGYWQE